MEDFKRYLGAKQHCALKAGSESLYLTRLSHFLFFSNLMKWSSNLNSLVLNNPHGNPVSMAGAPLAMFQAVF